MMVDQQSHWRPLRMRRKDESFGADEQPTLVRDTPLPMDASIQRAVAQRVISTRTAVLTKLTEPSTIAASLALATVSAFGLRNLSGVKSHLRSMTVASFLGTFASAMVGFGIYTALTQVFTVVADEPIHTISEMGKKVARIDSESNANAEKDMRHSAVETVFPAPRWRETIVEDLREVDARHAPTFARAPLRVINADSVSAARLQQLFAADAARMLAMIA